MLANKLVQVDCRTNGTLDVLGSSDGRTYTVQPENLVMQEGGYCMLRVSVCPGDGAILGAPFLRQCCTMYDMAKRAVGFARAKQ